MPARRTYEPWSPTSQPPVTTCSSSNRTTLCWWWDRQHLIEITREVGCRDTLRYEHRRAEQDMLLAVPDAIAWCWAKGRQWRDRIEPLVTEVRAI